MTIRDRLHRFGTYMVTNRYLHAGVLATAAAGSLVSGLTYDGMLAKINMFLSGGLVFAIFETFVRAGIYTTWGQIERDNAEAQLKKMLHTVMAENGFTQAPWRRDDDELPPGEKPN